MISIALEGPGVALRFTAVIVVAAPRAVGLALNPV